MLPVVGDGGCVHRGRALVGRVRIAVHASTDITFSLFQWVQLRVVVAVLVCAQMSWQGAVALQGRQAGARSACLTSQRLLPVGWVVDVHCQSCQQEPLDCTNPRAQREGNTTDYGCNGRCVCRAGQTTPVCCKLAGRRGLKDRASVVVVTCSSAPHPPQHITSAPHHHSTSDDEQARGLAGCLWQRHHKLCSCDA
jgi:hypothetical protein